MITESIIHLIQFINAIMPTTYFVNSSTEFQSLVTTLVGFWPTILSILSYVNYFLPFVVIVPCITIGVVIWLCRIFFALVNLIWP